MNRRKPRTGKNLAETYSDLAKEWHPSRNGKLTPFDVTPGSKKKVWWKCIEGDDHEWYVSVSNRKAGWGCPVCSGKKVVNSNCLATLNPALTKEWHPTKNGELTPFDIRPGSTKKVWWKCSRFKHHIWKTSINDRSAGTGCPKCNPSTSIPELRIYCELKSIFPSTQHRAFIAGHEVDVYIPELNFGIEYDGSYWHKEKIQKDQEKNIALQSTIFLLRIREKGLPKLSNSDIVLVTEKISVAVIKKILRSILKHRQIETQEVLDRIHDYLKSINWIASDRFRRLRVESNNVVFENSVSFLYPELAKEWHLTKNEPLLPEHFTPGSKKKVWWQNYYGHEWEATIHSRVRTIRNRIETDQLSLFKDQK